MLSLNGHYSSTDDYSLERFYRNAKKFKLLLKRLRSADDVVKYRCSNSAGTSSVDNPTVNISDIRFLNDPETDNDSAAGELGDALQVQLRNVLTLASSSDNHQDDDMVVDVVNHLEIIIENLSTDFNKYQSLLQYIGNHQNNPYLESISITAENINTFNPNRDDTITRQLIESEFLNALLPTTTNSITSTKAGLQKLTISGFHFMNPHPLVTFIRQTSIPILEMDCLSFLTSEDEYNNGVCNPLSDAFRNNASIQELSFEINLQTYPFITAVLKKLSYNKTLRRLRLEWSIFDFVVSDTFGRPTVESFLQEFIQTLVQYFTETQTLRLVELIDFEFIESDILQLLLTSISSNKSIQVLTLNKCSFDPDNVHLVSKSLFQRLHVQRFEMIGNRIVDEPHADLSHLMYRILPTNIFVQEIYITSKCLPSSSSEKDLESFRRSLVHRNRGIRQFIQQHAKSVNNNMLSSQPNNCANHVMFDVNYHLIELNEPIQATMEMQRRINHQYHHIQRTQKVSKVGRNMTLGNDIDYQEEICSKKQDDTIIPIELVPTILANHFHSPSSNHYGPTIIYQMISNFGHHQFH